MDDKELALARPTEVLQRIANLRQALAQALVAVDHAKSNLELTREKAELDDCRHQVKDIEKQLAMLMASADYYVTAYMPHFVQMEMQGMAITRVEAEIAVPSMPQLGRATLQDVDFPADEEGSDEHTGTEPSEAALPTRYNSAQN